MFLSSVENDAVMRHMFIVGPAKYLNKQKKKLFYQGHNSKTSISYRLFLAVMTTSRLDKINKLSIDISFLLIAKLYEIQSLPSEI